MRNQRIFAAFIFLISFFFIRSQGLYNINNIQKIEIKFSQSNWDYILDTAKSGADGYLVCQWVKINGTQLDSAGVKYKGNSSYNPNNAKNPFHIELDHVKNQDYQGYKDIKLSNGFKDPSFIREAVAYKIARKYMPAPDANFCQVYVNGSYIGLYTNCEVITKTYVNSHFYSKTNSFFFMDLFNCGLNYLGQDSSLYGVYTIKSDYGWNNLVRLCDTLNNFPGSVENILDVDRSIWMLAFDNMLVNLDSYIGGPKHNYYTYQDDNGRFNPIVWDLNESFGGFTNAGGGPALNISQMQTLAANLHVTDPNWPLNNKLLSNPTYWRMYIAHMRTILNENFVNGSYTTTALSYQAIIDTAVQSDVNKFFTYPQFLSNITTNVTSGPQTITGLTNLMDARQSYLMSTADFTYTPPTITSPTCVSSPSLNSVATITANITNSNLNGVYLGYRFDIKQRFVKIPMYDDGAHNDGVAGDNIFGASFTMTASVAQFYVYAENNNAGMFSPERAEYEFHTLASIQTPNSGDVSINEFLADNQNDVKNDVNQYADWIELYNNSNSIIDLSGSYLSDNFSNQTKFSFPANTLIQPNSFLIVWADEGTTTASAIHANFKLSSSGEQLILSNPYGTVLDSITFGQQTTDQSMARCPDGIGGYTVATIPTYSMSNCATGIHENPFENNLIRVFPNPANSHFMIENQSSSSIDISVNDILGRTILQGTVKDELVIPCAQWQAGVYFIKHKNFVYKLVITH